MTNSNRLHAALALLAALVLAGCAAPKPKPSTPGPATTATPQQTAPPASTTTTPKK